MTRGPLTELSLGCAQLGNLYRAIDDAEATATVDAAYACGIRYFDTAPHYGLGLSERRLGAALAGHEREELVVSTKVGGGSSRFPSRTGEMTRASTCRRPIAGSGTSAGTAC